MSASTVVRTRTQAATLVAPGAMHVEEAPAPEPREGEVLVRIEGCGVCASSMPVWLGRPWFDYPLAPGAPGHEAWGRELESGRRVAVLSDRGYAELVAVDRRLTVPLPPELDDSSEDEQFNYRARQGTPAPYVEIRARGDDGELIPWDDQAMGELDPFETLRVLQSPPEALDEEQIRLRRLAEDRLRSMRRIVEKRLTYRVEEAQQLAMPGL